MTIEHYLERIALALEAQAGFLGTDEQPPPVTTSTGTTTPTQAAPSTPRRTRRTAAQIAADNAAAAGQGQSVSPAASNATPAATAPAAGQQAQSQGMPTNSTEYGRLVAEAADIVLLLNESFEKEMPQVASKILAEHKVTRVSDLTKDTLPIALAQLQSALTSGTIMKLANDHSRDAAVGILTKTRVTAAGAQVPGVKRCSDLLPEFRKPVLEEARAAIAAAEASKSNSSLI